MKNRVYILYLVCTLVSAYLFLYNLQDGPVWRTVIFGFQLGLFGSLTVTTFRRHKKA